MKILYFGVYNPDYSRNRVLMKGLKANGVEIVECLVSAKSGLKHLKLFRRFMRSPGFDLMIVGFPGQEVMFLARLLVWRKPIIFDAFTSHYGGYILDRKKWPPNSLRAKYLKFLDKWSCKLADLVLLDTQAHIDFFVNEFKLDREKFLRIFVGTDDDVFYPHAQFGKEVANFDVLKNNSKLNVGVYPKETPKDADKFLVHFHGYHIPLQGVKYIIKAAKLLEKDNIHFNIIGNGQMFNDDLRLAESLSVGNIRFLEPVPYRELPSFMAKADVCLGIFGDSPKTDLVIPNKVYEAMAMGKPIITADTPAARELLSDGENVLFCRKADEKDLAEKIRFLQNSPDYGRIIGEGARKLFKENLTGGILAAELLKCINEKGLLSK